MKNRILKVISIAVFLTVLLGSICVIGETTAQAATKPVVSAIAGKQNIKVTWSSVEGAEVYFVLRSENATSGFEAVELTGPNERSFVDKKVREGKTYYYRVHAMKNGKACGYSDIVSATIKSETIFKITATPSEDSITVQWPSVEGTEIYFVLRSENATSGFEAVELTDATKRSFVDKNVSEGTTYYYKVEAMSGSNICGYSDVVLAMPVSAGSKEIDITVTPDLNNIKIEWSEVKGAEIYFVLRSENATSGFEAVELTVSSTTSFVDTGILPGTTYYYKVQAIANGNIFTTSDVVSATSADEEGTSIVAIANKDNVEIRWEEMEGAESYFLLRSENATSGFEAIELTGPGKTSFVDSDILPGITYYYRAQGVSSKGFYGYSDVVSVTP